MTNCHALKIKSNKDNKLYKTDCANRETVFRLIQSIPSPNAEPFKLWFARLAEERIQEINNPSLVIERAKNIYLKKDTLKNGSIHVCVQLTLEMN